MLREGPRPRGYVDSMWWLFVLACTEPSVPSSETGTVPAMCTGWGDPSGIDDVVDRLDDLPERSIPCVMASLQRPLRLMAVASVTSAQPGSWWSPRFFAFTDDLVLSVVPEGTGAPLLEMGEWTVEGQRTLKGELVFPLEEGHADPYTHIVDGDGTTCGACHNFEEAQGPPGVFESDAIEPTIGSRVPLDDVWEETEACDPDAEPERCAILRAVMGSNDVLDATWPSGAQGY